MKGDMPDPSPKLSLHPLRKDEQKKGIDYNRAYNALIRGFVRGYTARTCKQRSAKQESQGAQR